MDARTQEEFHVNHHMQEHLLSLANIIRDTTAKWPDWTKYHHMLKLYSLASDILILLSLVINTPARTNHTQCN